MLSTDAKLKAPNIPALLEGIMKAQYQLIAVEWCYNISTIISLCSTRTSIVSEIHYLEIQKKMEMRNQAWRMERRVE